MTNEEQIELLKQFARERFGSLRRMSLAVGKSQNYFAEYFAKGKLPPPHALRKLEHFGLPVEPFADSLRLSEDFDWGSDEPVQLETPVEPAPEPTARDEYEALHMYGGKPDWLDLPDEMRVKLEQRFTLLQMEIEEAEDACRRETERIRLERDGRVAGAVGAFRRSMLRQLLGEKPYEGGEF